MCRAEALGRRCPSATGPQPPGRAGVWSQHPRDGAVSVARVTVQRPRGICVLCDTTTHAAQQLHQGCWFWRIFKGKPRKSSPQRQNVSWWAGSCQGQVKGGDFEKPARVTSEEN